MILHNCRSPGKYGESASEQKLIKSVFYVKKPWVGTHYFAWSVMKSACRKPCRILSTIHTPSNKLQSNVRYRRGCTQVIAHICFLPRRIQTGNRPRLQTPCRAYNANNEMRQREAMRRHTELNIGANLIHHNTERDAVICLNKQRRTHTGETLTLL